jgi:uncharacterized protein YbjT (DUF2867 family)
MGEPESKVALLVGASGLAGGHVLDVLLGAADFARVYAVTRRPLGREHARLANRIVQFDRLEAQLKGLVCDTAFCCLGVSARDKTRSEQALRQVELDYVLAFARAARAGQAQRFVLLSCVGADSDSRSASRRIKSETEEAVEALGFPSLDILQPGPLIGLRREISLADTARGLSVLAATPLLFGQREAYRAIPVRTVAVAMLGAARSGRRGVYRYTHSAIRALASSPDRRRTAPAPGTKTPKPGQPPKKL